jgi:Mg-chelatase subunit ChlD
MNVPLEFKCPITNEIMKDPVLMPDGYTYERSAITNLLARKSNSPITLQTMTIDDAVLNDTIKHLIDNWISSYSTSDSHIPPQLHHQTKPDDLVHNSLQSQQFEQDLKSQSLHHIELSQFTARYLKNDDTNTVHIQITPKLIQNRLPLALIAMIDVSGSMNMNACETVTGMEMIDISRLELIQHALRTIVQTLGDTDELVFITFESRASLCLSQTKMNLSGKIRANQAIDEMIAGGGTNIWDALTVGFEQAKTFEGRGFNTSLLLFSDGESNENPQMGVVRTLRRAMTGMNQDFTISTFGFGYSVDSALLENIARLGHGIYGYCPDCTMVGTIFINFLATILTTIIQRAILEIQNTSYQEKYDLMLVNGSSRNVLIDIPDAEIGDAQIILSIPTTGDRFVLNGIDPITDHLDDPNRLAIIDQIYRDKVIGVIADNLLFPQQGFQQTHELFNEIMTLQLKTPFLEGLIIDLVHPNPNHGQISKAFQPVYFGKWGKNYLRSHLLFHMAEQCGNFKDESLQRYGGPNFQEYRTLASKIFVNIPPPAGRMRQNHSTSTITASSTLTTPISMTKFYDYDGGCFDGNGIVSLLIGEKRVCDLEKGDILKDGGIIKCLIEMSQNRQCDAVILNGVAFTPFHPVEIDGEWIFPRDIGDIVKININSWFNLVVKGNKVVELNGVRAITLGHGLNQGVLKHPYFGTKVVIRALQRYDGYNSGRLHLMSPTKCERDENGMIVHLF